MTSGLETHNRWLWFLTYIFLPFNVLGQIFVLFWLGSVGNGSFNLGFILVEAVLTIATLLGLHLRKPWGWYCMLLIFAMQLVGAPLKVYAKASMGYEITKTTNEYLQSQGRQTINTAKPSAFGFEPMLTFFLVMGIWTIPNVIYLYRRKHIFGIGEFPVRPGHFNNAPTSPRTYIVSAAEEEAYAQAQEELDSGNIRQGLWAKVSAEETSHEQRKVKYLQYRALQLWQPGKAGQPKEARLPSLQKIKEWSIIQLNEKPWTVLILGLVSVIISYSIWSAGSYWYQNVYWTTAGGGGYSGLYVQFKNADGVMFGYRGAQRIRYRNGKCIYIFNSNYGDRPDCIVESNPRDIVISEVDPFKAHDAYDVRIHSYFFPIGLRYPHRTLFDINAYARSRNEYSASRQVEQEQLRKEAAAKEEAHLQRQHDMQKTLMGY